MVWIGKSFKTPQKIYKYKSFWGYLVKGVSDVWLLSRVHWNFLFKVHRGVWISTKSVKHFVLFTQKQFDRLRPVTVSRFFFIDRLIVMLQVDHLLAHTCVTKAWPVKRDCVIVCLSPTASVSPPTFTSASVLTWALRPWCSCLQNKRSDSSRRGPCRGCDPSREPVWLPLRWTGRCDPEKDTTDPVIWADLFKYR